MNGIITTIAGTGNIGYSGDDGDAKNALLSYPTSVSVDATGNVYIADCNNDKIRKVSYSHLVLYNSIHPCSNIYRYMCNTI